ncbi:MAG: acyl-CoA reductase [Candidatus Egerieousia sp.]
MTKAEFLHSFTLLREIILDFLDSPESESIIGKACRASALENNFFTLPMQKFALRAIAEKFLSDDALEYLSKAEAVEKKVGIIMAGNIPAVGFLDLLCALACGCKAMVKLSSKDRYLIPALCGSIVERCDDLKRPISESVLFSDSKEGLADFFNGVDPILFSGSDGSASSVLSEFPETRKLLRGSRFSFAVVTGDESDEELAGLASDILLYCGLGCRSVSYLLVPDGYDFERLKTALLSVGNHLEVDRIGPFHNMVARNRAVAALSERLSHGGVIKKGEMADCGCILLENSPEPFPPLGVVRFCYYDNIDMPEIFERTNIESVQKKYTTFGNAQRPEIYEWPDGVNIINFLCSK